MHLRSGFLMLGIALAACSAPTGADETVAASDSAIVASVMADTAQVQADRLVFAKSVVPTILRTRIDAFDAAMKSGKDRASIENVIVAGDRGKDALDASGKVREGAANPYGFIRRALSYRDEGDKTIVMTEQASLDEAFSEFDEGRIVQVGADPSASGAVTPQFGKQLHYNIPIINVDGQDLYNQGETSVHLKSGHVNLDTTIDLGASISWFRLKDAHVVVDAAIDSEIIVEAKTRGAFSKTLDHEVFRGSWPIGSIGPVPVTLGVTATVGCDVQAAGSLEASAGMGMNITMKAGVTYERDHGMSPVWESPRFTPRTIAPVVDASGNATTRCYLRPQLSVLLFDAAGPTVTPELAGKLTAATPPLTANLVGELNVDVGGKLSIFGHDLGAVDFHLVTLDKDLWKYPN